MIKRVLAAVLVILQAALTAAPLLSHAKLSVTAGDAEVSLPVYLNEAMIPAASPTEIYDHAAVYDGSGADPDVRDAFEDFDYSGRDIFDELFYEDPEDGEDADEPETEFLYEDEFITEDGELPEDPQKNPREGDDWLFSEVDEAGDDDEYRLITADMKGNEKKIFRYLTESMGLNTAAACGVLANISCESGFKTWAVGDSGTSYGLCQWHNGRRIALLKFVSNMELKRTSLEGQLKYMRYELEAGSYQGVYRYLKNVPDTADGAYKAGGYFCMYYEIPANRVSTAKSRGNLARRTYWAAYAEGVDTASVMVRRVDDDDADEDDTVKTARSVVRDIAASITQEPEDGVLHDVFDDNTGAESDVLPERVWVLGLEDSYEYTGEPVKPDIRVYDGVTLLEKNEDYTVSYQRYDEVGTARIRVTLLDSGEEFIQKYEITEPEEGITVTPAGYARVFGDVFSE